MVDVKFSMFFDRPGVLKKVKDGTQSALSRFGAFVRTSAQRSIRPGGKKNVSAAPGQPPRGHVGWLRKLIFFGYDSGSESVVVGPQLFGKHNSPTVPNVLEQGGMGTTSQGKPAMYHKFPFMEPALTAEQDKFAGLFQGAIK